MAETPGFHECMLKARLDAQGEASNQREDEVRHSLHSTKIVQTHPGASERQPLASMRNAP